MKTPRNTPQRATWLAQELSVSGCSIFSTHGFASRSDAETFVSGRPGWEVRPAGEHVYYLPA
jgi:hypothetical protein